MIRSQASGSLIRSGRNAAPAEDDTSFLSLSEDDFALVYGPGPTIGSGEAFPASFTVDTHSHDRDQLLYPGTGMVTVTAEQGSWLLPAERALWIPAGVEHSVSMVGPVLARSIFADSALRVRSSASCEVIVVSPLLHALLMAVYEAKDGGDDLRKKMRMSLLMMEVRRAPVEPLAMALPTTKTLASKCRRYLANPTPHETIDDWSDELGMSRRAFTRVFRRETGQSFASWRQKACLFAALPRLAAGETVTSVAFTLGYSSAAAFTSMFRRVLGETPRNYLERGATGAANVDLVGRAAQTEA